jgi:biotin carboxyl carrier protein
VDVRSEMLATVWRVLVAHDAAVSSGDELMLLESMKMEIPVVAPVAGRIAAVHVAEGQSVAEGDLLIEITEAQAGQGPNSAATSAASDSSVTPPN